MHISVIRNRAGFKVKSKADCKTLITELLMKGGKYYIPVNPRCEYRIEVENDGRVKLYVRTGDLTDPFNPELQVPDSRIIDTLYQRRRHINKTFFNDEY